MNKKIAIIVFVLVAIIQLYIPAQMIFNNENVLETGVEYKFKTAPIDPVDPFRGKYVHLRFEEDEVEIDTTLNWQHGDFIYLQLNTDYEGFAQIKSASKEAPTNGENYLKAKVRYIQYNDNIALIEYPFNKYFMEETKAYQAELEYRESAVDSNQVAYALVSIKDGDAVLQNVFINDEPIKEVVEKALAEADTLTH